MMKFKSTLDLFLILQFQIMSDDLRQMMAYMMEQMKQQQSMITKLSSELSEEKKKNQAPQQATLNQSIKIYTNQKNERQRSSSIYKTASKSSQSTCPQGHYSNKIYLNCQFCNKCTNTITCGQTCTKCSYSMCRNCYSVRHTDFCSEDAWLPYNSCEFCIACGNTKTGGKFCQKCKFRICRDCKPASHKTFCSCSDFTYYSKCEYCLTCGNTRAGGKKCLDCGYNTCSYCN